MLISVPAAAQPLPDESVDVIISNGAFCLVPDKKQGFAEAYRVLKPGGRMAVCTTTVKDALPEGVEWPICKWELTYSMRTLDCLP